MVTYSVIFLRKCNATLELYFKFGLCNNVQPMHHDVSKATGAFTDKLK